MPQQDGSEFELNLLRRQLESSLVSNLSLAKENEELRLEVSRLKAQITTLQLHNHDRKSMLWKKLQNSSDNDADLLQQKPTFFVNLSGQQEATKERPLMVPNPPQMAAPQAPPPPPPPIPSKALIGTKAVRRVPEVLELYRSLTRHDTCSESKTGPMATAPALALSRNMIGEIENRSTYISAVKSEVQTQADFINLLIKEVESAAHEKISDVEAFVNWLDKQLSSLVDERAVLKHFPQWPERKADTLREAAFNYRDLRNLKSEVLSFEDNPQDPLSQATRRTQELQDRLERSVSNVERTRESTGKRYRGYKIPWEWMMDTGLIGEMKLSSLRLGKEYMKRITRELQSGECTTRDDNRLLQGVRFAYRIHQGGSILRRFKPSTS